MNVNEAMYGINNENYIIESIDEPNITVKYRREVIITYNADIDKRVETKTETLTFNFSEIGINIFFKKNDCNMTVYDLLQDDDYREYKNNLYERLEKEEKKRKEELERIRKNAPEEKMTPKEKDLKLLEYENKDLSMKEEIEFYEKANIPYFARIDTDTEYYTEHYYERIYLTKEKIKLKYIDNVKIINWRAPLANLYFDKEENILEINNYKYETMLKRGFTFFPLRYVNKYIENNSFYQEGTVDEFLLNILMEKRNSDNLTDIIYSIQSNQNKIIRADKNENFVVQGCAGSGKTMILLHRLSYLKFNNMLPEYDRIKIITPNKIFNNFINDLSHDLDINEIEQITISNYYNILNDLYMKSYNKIIYNKAELKEVKELKEKINKLIDDKKSKYKRLFEKEKMIDENEMRGKTVKQLYSEEVYQFIQNEYNRKIDDIKQLIEQLQISDKINSLNIYHYLEGTIYKLIKKVEDIVKYNDKLKDNLRYKKDMLKNLQIKLKNQGNDYKNNEKTYNKLKEELKNKEKKYENLIEKDKTIFNKIKKMVTSNRAKNLLKNEIIILEGKIEKIEKELEIEQVPFKKLKDEISNIETENNKILDRIKEKEEEKNTIENNIMDTLNTIYFTIDFYEDIIEKLKAKNILPIEKGEFGRCQLLMYLYINYLHFGELINCDKLLCFDEAQDYNLLEYKILKDVNKNVIFNLYGDVNQSFYEKGIVDWRELISELNLKKYCLNENYRNTTQITEFCNKQFNFDIVPMGLDGINVEHIKPNQINDIIARKIKEGRKVAIIYADKNELNNIKKDPYITCSTVSMAKGIEYDTVIVKDTNMNQNEKYVSYTRALNELYILDE